MPSHRHMAVKNGHNPSGKKQIKNTERAKLAFSVLFFNSMFLACAALSPVYAPAALVADM